MSFREKVSYAITGLILLGLLVLGIGIVLWLSRLIAQFHLAVEYVIVLAGFLIVIFGILAAKIFSKVELG